MIERELSDALFLRPIEPVKNDFGYLSRQDFFQQLRKGAVIGQYNRHGTFVVDSAQTEYYQPFIADIADALSRPERDHKYRQYKIASIEKGNLDIHFEWHLEQVFNFKQIKFRFGNFAKQLLGINILLLDMHGPAYEVILPMTFDSLLEQLNFSVLRKLTRVLRQKQKNCVNKDYQKLSTLTRSVAIFGHICKDCPCLCKMDCN